jgi:serine protease Do
MIDAMRGLLVVAVMALVSSCAGTASQAALTPRDIVKRSNPAIVWIDAGPNKVGTGFLLDKSGVIATNLHVIAGESQIQVRLFDGSLHPVEMIVGVDPDRDLALLRIKAAKDLPTLKLGDSDTISVGDRIYAIGNPLGVFDYSVTEGLISGVRPYCGKADVAAQRCRQELTVLQFSAQISPGSSGGPLFNQSGEVIGIATAIITAGQGINLAVPANYLKPLVAQRAAIAIGLDAFARNTRSPEDAAPDRSAGPRIVRRIPRHEIAVYDGCRPEDIQSIIRQIGEAIEAGAPLYNDAKHEACFRIYEGTAVKFERDAPCVGVRAAFGDGLLRAGGLTSYTEKAWAMRDTFDGLLDAARRWSERQASPSAPPGPAALPAKPRP